MTVDTMLIFFQSAGVLIVGLILRFLLLVLVLAVLAVPILLVLYGARGLQALVRRALGVDHVRGFLWRRDVYYAPGHTWIRREAGRLRIGLDDLAQRLLPGARAVAVMAPGTRVHKGDVVGEIACENKTARIPAPVDGVVVEANDALKADPSLLHRDPYRRGWLVTIAPVSADWLALMRGRAAREWLDQEARHLTHFLERELGVAAADGGEFLVPPPSLLSVDQWQAVTREFLKSESSS